MRYKSLIAIASIAVLVLCILSTACTTKTPSDDVQVTDMREIGCTVSGTVKNVKGDYTAKDVKVFIECFDSDGDRIGKMSDSVGNLGEEETATFSITLPSDVCSEAVDCTVWPEFRR